MKINLGKRTFSAFCAIIVSVILIGIITNYNVDNLTESQNQISHTYQVIEKLNSIEAAMLDMSASSRGYVITGDVEFLAPYESASALIDKKLDDLSDLTRDNPLQVSNVKKLKDMIKQRNQRSDDVIKTRKDVGAAAADELVSSGVGEDITKQIKAQIATMKDMENGLLQDRVADSERKNRDVTIVLIVSSAAIIGIASVLLVLFNRDASRQMETQRKLLLGEQKTTELAQFDKLKDEFAAMITHELKTPIVPITGYCKMLKTEMLGTLNKDQQEAVDVIDQSTEQLVTLISDILDARKLDLNKMKFNIEEISVDEFFDSLNSGYRQVLLEKGKEFAVDVPERGLVITADRMRLRQIFDTLISNAINYTLNEDPRITGGCKKDGGEVIMYVKDNGVGIPVDAQRDLFKKFYQADTSERRKIGGTGLGLAISKGILDKLNADIWVESDGKTGTAFYIKFRS